MEDRKPNICRLCFSVIIDFQLLNNIQQDIIQILLPELDITICCNNIAICTDCDTILQDLFKFKSACLEIEDNIHSYTNNKNTIDLDKIIGLQGMDMPCDEQGRCPKICRTCLELTQPDNMKELKEDDDDMLLEILTTCFPELDTSLTKCPVICKKCSEQINKYFSYYNKCMENDTKIKVYLDNNYSEDVNLYEIIYASQNESVSSSENEKVIVKEKNDENNTMFNINQVETSEDPVSDCDTEINEIETVIISSNENSIDASDVHFNRTISVKDENLRSVLEQTCLNMENPLQSFAPVDNNTNSNLSQDILLHDINSVDNHALNGFKNNNQKNCSISNDVQSTDVSLQIDCSFPNKLNSDKANIDSLRNKNSTTSDSLSAPRKDQSVVDSIDQLSNSGNHIESSNENLSMEVETVSPYNIRKQKRKLLVDPFQYNDDKKDDPDYEMEVDALDEQDVGYRATELKKKKISNKANKSNICYVKCTWCGITTILPMNLDKHRATCRRRPYIEKGSLKLCKYCEFEVSDIRGLMNHLRNCSLYLNAKNKVTKLIQPNKIKVMNIFPFCKYCKQKYNISSDIHLKNCSPYLLLKQKVSGFLNLVEKQNATVSHCFYCNTVQSNASFQDHLENCAKFLHHFYETNQVETHKEEKLPNAEKTHCLVSSGSPNDDVYKCGKQKLNSTPKPIISEHNHKKIIIKSIHKIIAPKISDENGSSNIILGNKKLEANTELISQYVNPNNQQTVMQSGAQQPIVFQVCSQMYQMDSTSQDLNNTTMTSVNMQQLPTVTQQIIQNMSVNLGTTNDTVETLKGNNSNISLGTTIAVQMPVKNLVTNSETPTFQKNNLTFKTTTNGNDTLISVCTNMKQLDSVNHNLSKATVTTLNEQHLPTTSKQVIQSMPLSLEANNGTATKLKVKDSNMSLQNTVEDTGAVQLPVLTVKPMSNTNPKVFPKQTTTNSATNIITNSNDEVQTVSVVRKNSFTVHHFPVKNKKPNVTELEKLTISSLLDDPNVKYVSEMSKCLKKPIILKHLLSDARSLTNTSSLSSRSVESSTSKNNTFLKPVDIHKTNKTENKVKGSGLKSVQMIIKEVQQAKFTDNSKCINLTENVINPPNDVIDLVDDDTVVVLEPNLTPVNNSLGNLNCPNTEQTIVRETVSQYLKVLKCNYCSFNTRKDTVIQKHSLEHIPENSKSQTQYLCKECNHYFNTAILLQSHLKQVHYIVNYTVYTWCVKCGILVEADSDLSNHICPVIDKWVRMFRSNGVAFCMDCNFENSNMKIAKLHSKVCGTQSVASEIILIED